LIAANSLDTAISAVVAASLQLPFRHNPSSLKFIITARKSNNNGRAAVGVEHTQAASLQLPFRHDPSHLKCIITAAESGNAAVGARRY
jgi:hypothetical protein